MKFKERGRELTRHFMTGVSYMIPLVTASGLLTSIGLIVGGQGAWTEGSSTLAGTLVVIGTTGLGLIVPIIAAYISYSIADKPGLIPAFIVGMVANTMGTGFLGGMLVGIVTGYFVEFLKNMRFPSKLESIRGIIFIPLVATLVVGLLLVYVIGTPIALMTESITAWLSGMQSSNKILLASIIGAMMAIDMGGPINKIANTFGMACFAEGIFHISTYMLTAIAIPPLGLALATFIGKKYFSSDELENGKSAIVMGACGITEAAIPFAIADPLCVIPSIMLGSVVTCSLTAAFNIVGDVSLATIMMIPFASNPFLYILSIVAGVVVTALSVIFLKSRKQRKVSA